jgi:hypothetical protein
MAGERVRNVEYEVNGERLVETVKGLLHEGNIRRITLKDEQGRTLIEIPLTLGVIGAVLLPAWAAIGAITALAGKMKIVVEKVE